MSQNEGSFQSKPRRGGQKFGGPRGDRKFGGNKGFSDRYKGDRDRTNDRPARSFDRPDRPPRDRAEGASDRPRKPFRKREFGDRDSRPPREFNREDRPFRSRDGAPGGGDRPFKKRRFEGEGRPFGDKKPYNKERSFGDKKPYNKERSFDDKKPYDKERNFRDKKPYNKDRSFGDKKPYNKERSFGDKKPYSKEGRTSERKPFNKFDSRPQKSYKRYDDRPRRDFREQPEQVTEFDAQKLKSPRPSYGAPSGSYLYGVHAVTQALLNPERTNKRLLCTEKSFEGIQEAWAEAQTDGVTLPEVITVEKEDIDRLLPRDAVHQDLLLDCSPLVDATLQEILLTMPEDGKVLILDQVTDPHNVGAILRSAAAFGARAVIVQTLHAPEITGVLAKSASGAVEHVPLVREVNLNRTMEQLKKAGFFCIGLAEEGKQTLAQLKLSGKIALVLGAEGAGLRRLVAENCDELAKLPTQGEIGSLNVSNAAAIALYELNRN